MISRSRKKHLITVQKSSVRTTPRARFAAWLACGLIGGMATNGLDTFAQEPKWTPHPFQNHPNPNSMVEPTTRTIPAKSKSVEDDGTPAPVQRWRKAEATTRPTQASRPTTHVSPTFAITTNEEMETAASAKRIRPRDPVITAAWQSEDPSNNPSDLPSEPVRLKSLPIDKERLVYQDSEGAKASDPPTIPNPFPRPKSDASSDRVQPLQLDGNAADLPPPPPADLRRGPIHCDTARDFLSELDIRRIRVDSSPLLSEGYSSGDRAKRTKESFRADAESRIWYSISGQEVARGKLFDLVFDSVVIEKEDGSKTTVLVRKLSDPDQVYVAESWGIPVTCALGDQEVAARIFADSVLTWKASGLCHKPLYFQDVQLERYGHEWGPVVQPALSTVRFFGDLAVLPYKMGIHPPNECQYSLGYYRPGDCAPWTRGPIPISLRGAISQAAFVTGTAWALP